ncbi:N-acetylmuramoyl-L-alanine amidase family protein [Marinisporobacter balticus]|uniref:N-acetylmuramoyl-L-alanine amidase n=1 Tax=Marinisporobacter balticus TaxID=2018667 RepID=A0A4R2KBP9_9FIRM|nr:N-acetylmuramoyl-L-alanine amidase [Marinisporobacter balticus]TCO69487.1 N-acetylmuramoyl-L-alanine amidase [Marinisporobacter balticus]
MKTIVVDPGHGGNDRANRGYSGKYIEADGNLQFALFLHYYLKDYFNVILTRKEDKTLSLTERGKMAKGADMFLSAHSDAWEKESNGVTIFDSVDLSNETLGAEIGKAIADSMGIKFKGVRERESQKNKGEDYYTVIDVAQDIGCPVVLLLERGFHSNPHEEQLLLNNNIVRESAKAVAEKIKAYYGVSESAETKEITQPIWKYQGLEYLAKNGLLNDLENWKKKIDEPMPVWASGILLAEIHKNLKGE